MPHIDVTADVPGKDTPLVIDESAGNTTTGGARVTLVGEHGPEPIRAEDILAGAVVLTPESTAKGH